MTTNREHRLRVKGDSGIELGELRWLIDQLEGAPDGLKVTVKAHVATDMRDSSTCSLEVDVPEGIPHRPNPIAPHYPPGVR